MPERRPVHFCQGPLAVAGIVQGAGRRPNRERETFRGPNHPHLRDRPTGRKRRRRRRRAQGHPELGGTTTAEANQQEGTDTRTRRGPKERASARNHQSGRTQRTTPAKEWTSTTCDASGWITRTTGEGALQRGPVQPRGSDAVGDGWEIWS